MPYTDFNWITDRFAVGAIVSEPEEAFPFDAVISLETHAPATLRELALSADIEYRWYSIIDGYSWEGHDGIIRRFDAAARQINDWLTEGKRVLIHCTAGVSRSVTAVVWYLVRYQGYTWERALETVREFRPQANPNPRFEIPLRIAAGEDVTEEWLELRIKAFCARMADVFGLDMDPDEVWNDLERQGTLAHLRATT